jgi:hypothetical protein
MSFVKTINLRESCKMLSRPTFDSIKKIKNSRENCSMILARLANESMTLRLKFISYNMKMKA